MIILLISAHIVLFVLSLVFDQRKGVERLRNLTIPVGLAFLYTSVAQAWAAAKSPGFYLEQQDIAPALWVSFVSYLAFLVAYRLADKLHPPNLKRDEVVNVRRLNAAGVIFFLVGFTGYYYSIQAVGGWREYLGLLEWSGYLYAVSGYLYMAKYAVYTAVACWLISYSLGGLRAGLHALLLLCMLGLLFESVQATDRGDTIRASLPLVAWIYFLSRKTAYAVAANLLIALILLAVGLAVVLLPEFRGTQRSLLASEVTLTEAVDRAQEKQGSSRLSAEGGGEFDTAARIIKRVNAGDIKHPGPVHIARLFWNMVPRAFVPEKWELFDQWAGPHFEAIWHGSASYPGCTPTGWGEAYGCMGWFGALAYWCAMGYLARRFVGWLGASDSGLIVSVILYLPLLNYVVMTFFSASMTLCTVVLPLLLGLQWARFKMPGRAQRNRKVRRRAARQPLQPAVPQSRNL